VKPGITLALDFAFAFAFASLLEVFGGADLALADRGGAGGPTSSSSGALFPSSSPSSRSPLSMRYTGTPGGMILDIAGFFFIILFTFAKRSSSLIVCILPVCS
jgi:hypothetical protein